MRKACFLLLLCVLACTPAIGTGVGGGKRLAVVLGMGSIPTKWVLTGYGKVAWVQEGSDNEIATALSTKLGRVVGGGT